MILFMILLSLNYILASDWQMFGNNPNNTRYSPDLMNYSLEMKWNFTTSAPIYSSPVIANSILFLTSTDNKTYALNAVNGNYLWNFSTNSSIYSSPAIVNNIVYITSTDNKTYALNATNGTIVWSYLTSAPIYSSPIITNNIVYITSTDNKTYALNSTNGNYSWNYTTSAPIYSSPAIANNIVYITSTDNKTYALNSTNGTILWSYSTTSPIYSSPAIANNIVYITSTDNKTYALNATNGTILWSYSTSAPIYSSPAINNGLVYIVSNDNMTYVLGSSNGSLVINFSSISGITNSSPTISNNYIYISSPYYSINIFNISTGELLWYYTTGSSITSSPVLSNNMLYVSSNDHTIYAFGDDISAPVVTLTSPEDGYETSENSINFVFTMSDSSFIKNCSLSIVGKANSTTLKTSGLVSPYTISKSLSIGNYTWKVNCSDSAGNIGVSETRNLSIVDTPDSSTTSTSSAGDSNSSSDSYWKQSYSISDKQFTEGYTRDLFKSQRIMFNINQTSHFIGVLNLTNTTVKLRLQSTPIEATLTLGEDKKFDIDKDDFFDIEVIVNDLSVAKVNLTIKKTHEQSFFTNPLAKEIIDSYNKTVSNSTASSTPKASIKKDSLFSLKFLDWFKGTPIWLTITYIVISLIVIGGIVGIIFFLTHKKKQKEMPKKIKVFDF